MILTVKDLPVIIDPAHYYKHPAMSNSDLGLLEPKTSDIDPTEAYAFGNLVDHLITEPEKVDVYQKTCECHVFTTAQMALAQGMRSAFLRDPLCKMIMGASSFQDIMLREVHHGIGHVQFTLHARCKWDLWMKNWGGDIKTTTAETQEQFEAAAKYFHYPRQRFVYMTLGRSEKDILIGISKKPPHKIFKIMIRKGDAFWQEGADDYERLVMEYWKLYGGI